MTPEERAQSLYKGGTGIPSKGDIADAITEAVAEERAKASDIGVSLKNVLHFWDNHRSQMRHVIKCARRAIEEYEKHLVKIREDA